MWKICALFDCEIRTKKSLTTDVLARSFGSRAPRLYQIAGLAAQKSFPRAGLINRPFGAHPFVFLKWPHPRYMRARQSNREDRRGSGTDVLPIIASHGFCSLYIASLFAQPGRRCHTKHGDDAENGSAGTDLDGDIAAQLPECITHPPLPRVGSERWCEPKPIDRREP
jgi:hypothetical protein